MIFILGKRHKRLRQNKMNSRPQINSYFISLNTSLIINIPCKSCGIVARQIPPLVYSTSALAPVFLCILFLHSLLLFFKFCLILVPSSVTPQQRSWPLYNSCLKSCVSCWHDKKICKTIFLISAMQCSVYL